VARVVALLAVLWGLGACGVPVPPTVTDLEARASRGDASAARELIALLRRGSDGEVRSEAYQALLRLGAGVQDAAILEACRSEDAVLREHALALAANLRLPGVRDEAVRALQDRAFPRRYVAAWVLGELGDPAGVGPLVAAVGGSDAESAKEAARSLVKLGRASVEPLLDALPGLDAAGRGYALRTLGEIQDPRAVPAAVAALASPVGRVDGAWALGKLGAVDAAPALRDLLSDPEWRVRLEAARALGLLEDRASGEALARLRESDPEPSVREWAARSLALLTGAVEKYRDARGEWVEPDSLYR
jgi:HEAT repeat protein